jgi:signal transduction histidine kinase
MYKWVLILVFICSKAGFCQVNSCEKEVMDFELNQLKFSDAKKSANEFWNYINQNRARLTPDCTRRMYSLLANFSALSSSLDSADVYFRIALRYSDLCKSDTAKIYATIDYARFLNNVRPDSFKEFIDTVYFKLLDHTKRNNLRYYDYLKKLSPNTTATAFSTSEINNLSAGLISDMNDTDKSLWRMYYEMKGSALVYTTAFDEAEKNIKLALFFDRNNLSDDNESVSLNNLGILYQNAGRHIQALEYFFASVERNKKNNEEFANINTLSNISYSFRVIKRFDVARKYSLEAIEISKRLNLSKNLCRSLSQYASVFIEEGNYTEAEKILKESINLSHSTGNNADLCYSMRKLADLLLNDDNRLLEAKLFIDSSFYYEKLIGDKSFLFYINNTLASYYFKMNEYDKSLSYALSSYAESINYNDKEIAIKDLYLLYQIYEKKNNTPLALQYYKSYIQMRDSSIGKEMHYALSDIQEKYDSQKKQLAIESLEKEKLNKQQQSKWLIAALGITLLLSGLFYLFNRKLNNQKLNLQQTNTLLNEVTATQNRLFGIIGHDLKGMVAPFSRAGKIMSNYVSKNNMDGAVKFSLKLEENAGRLSDTLNNLLYWSLQQMKGLKIQKESINVFETIGHVVHHYEDVIHLKNITIKLDVPITDRLISDKEAFQIIIRNLLSNALKFTENNIVQFSSQESEDDYTLMVIDNGVGMPEEQLNSLFSNIEIKTSVGTQGEIGTGLGLVAVKKIVQALNATLKIESKLNFGTVISVKFKK